MSKLIKEYTIVHGNLDNISAIINEMLKSGWDLKGDLIAVYREKELTHFYQVMIKYDKEEDH